MKLPGSYHTEYSCFRESGTVLRTWPVRTHAVLATHHDSLLQSGCAPDALARSLSSLALLIVNRPTNLLISAVGARLSSHGPAACRRAAPLNIAHGRLFVCFLVVSRHIANCGRANQTNASRAVTVRASGPAGRPLRSNIDIIGLYA